MYLGRLFMLFLFGLVLAVGPSTQAGEVIDFLPEVQMARSLVHLLEFGDVDEDDCISISLDEPIPSNLLYDQNGMFHSDEQIVKILTQINCIILELAELDLDNADANIPLFIDAFSGETAQFANGRILDGRKQAVRASFIFGFLLLFQFELSGLFDLGLLGSDPCAQLRDWSAVGPSLEFRFTAFFTLLVQLAISDEEQRQEQCTTIRGDLEQELIAQAEAGSVDAAVELSFLWTSQLEERFGDEPTIDELPAMQIEIDRFELLMLENTMKFPLVTLAATVPLAGLYRFEHIFTTNN